MAIKLNGAVDTAQSTYSNTTTKISIENKTKKRVSNIITVHMDDNVEALYLKVCSHSCTKREYRVLTTICRDIYGMRLKDFII